LTTKIDFASSNNQAKRYIQIQIVHNIMGQFIAHTLQRLLGCCLGADWRRKLIFRVRDHYHILIIYSILIYHYVPISQYTIILRR